MFCGIIVLLFSLCLCNVVFVGGQSQGNTGRHVEVSTRYGNLLGIRTQLGEDLYVDTFFKIPYAKPPLGDLRFRPPQPYGSWTGVRAATEMGAKCPQRISNDDDFPVSEDCLFLNIYAPTLPADGRQLPVMVWIHGGSYVAGTGNTYDGAQLASRGVVVVTINYRLDSLGFLCTEDAVSPGNYGLLDQIRALQWVHDAISAFNGDPNDVTIFGESAGSFSVSLLLLSPLANGLYTKAIMQSGVSLSDWAVAYPGLDPKIKEKSKELAQRVSCPDNDMTRMLSCLKTVNAMLLAYTSAQMTENEGRRLIFRPVVESTFGQVGVLAATPRKLLENGWFPNVPTIRGFNHDETGQLFSASYSHMSLDQFRETTRAYLQNSMQQSSFFVDLDTITDKLAKAYVIDQNITDPEEITAAAIQLTSDYPFTAPTVLALQLVTAYHVKPQYLYRFSYRSPNSLREPVQGVVHTAEMAYVFGYPVTGVVPSFARVSAWTDDDKRVSNDVMTLWTNFAKYGDPSGNSTTPKWLPWTSASRGLLDISNSLTSQRLGDVKLTQLRLWNNITEEYVYSRVNNSVIG